MNNQARKGAAAVALSSLACGLILSATALAQDRNSKANPTAAETPDSPDVGIVFAPPAEQAVTSSGDEGGIAGAVVWDNGPLVTGVAVCTPAGSASDLQDTAASQNLNTFGYGAQGGTVNNRMADDFSLTACTDLTSIAFSMYQTGASPTGAPTITGVNLTLHSGQPLNPADQVLQTLTGVGVVTVSSPLVYRQLGSGPGNDCARYIQTITVDVSAWPDLAAGSYWISWQATGTLASGPWQPPVTIAGACGATGANAMQSIAGAAFAPAIDGLGAPCTAVPQDMPFIVRGVACGGASCPGNIVTTGSSATNVDIDDLLAVIAAWGPCPAPPASCPANIATGGASATTVDIDDLLAVISAWGPCP